MLECHMVLFSTSTAVFDMHFELLLLLLSFDYASTDYWCICDDWTMVTMVEVKRLNRDITKQIKLIATPWAHFALSLALLRFRFRCRRTLPYSNAIYQPSSYYIMLTTHHRNSTINKQTQTAAKTTSESDAIPLATFTYVWWLGASVFLNDYKSKSLRESTIHKPVCLLSYLLFYLCIFFSLPPAIIIILQIRLLVHIGTRSLPITHCLLAKKKTTTSIEVFLYLKILEKMYVACCDYCLSVLLVLFCCFVSKIGRCAHLLNPN